MIERIIPLLNKVVPSAIAFKGLQKLDPRIGKFFTQAQEKGYGQDEIMEFMRNEFQGGGEQDQRLRPDERSAQRQVEQSRNQGQAIKGLAQTAATAAGAAGLGGLGLAGAQALGSMMGGGENQTEQQRQETQLAGPKSAPSQEDAIKDFIQQYPELGNAILKYGQSGVTPEDAAMSLKQTQKHRDAIQRLEKESGMDFIDLIGRLFGGGQGSRQQQQPISRPQENGQQATQQQPKNAEIQNQIKAALNKIMQM